MSVSQEKSGKSCRPREHLAAMGAKYPGAWRQVDYFREWRGRDGLPEWAEWCFLPMAAYYSIVSASVGHDRVPQHMGEEIGRLAAMGAWRTTQGIYRFDPALYVAIRDTPVDGALPCDVLYRLPEWAVYVETPDMEWMGIRLYGFFAHLEQDANDGRAELRLLLDIEGYLLPLPLHIGDWPLSEAISRYFSVASANAAAGGANLEPLSDQVTEKLSASLEPLISLLLYLCSKNAEIGDGSRRPGRPQPKKTKNGWRLFPADKPAIWDVGVRIGAALRRAYHAAETRQAQSDAAGRAIPRAHVRRAHWHGFWTGPRNTPEDRKLELRWLPPIPVNVDDAGDLPATVRPVS